MKVLCINGDFRSSRLRPTFQYIKALPKELDEYTVREVKEVDGRTGYCLVEICAGFNPNGAEISFDSSRFIPLQEINSEVEEVNEEKECLVLA